MERADAGLGITEGWGTMARPLYVARPMLPELKDVHRYLEGIWETRFLTNGGPLHEKLEREMRDYLSVPCAMLFNNGTIALLVALKMMNLPPGSEVITTPLTFAATAHAIAWNWLTPVFVDVTPDTLTIDPPSVEEAITSKTSAILAVHVYGKVAIVNEEKLYESLKRLVNKYETVSKNPVSIETLPEDLIQRLLKGVVGLEISIEKIEGKWKLSQNRNDESAANVIRELESLNDSNAQLIANEMKRLR